MDDADVYLSAWWKLGIGYVYPGLVLRYKIWIGLKVLVACTVIESIEWI